MKMISILAATVLVAGSATASFAQTYYLNGQAREMSSNTAYTPATLMTGRSVGEMLAPRENCQKGEPSISPNGIATLSDMAICRQ